jgi:hypothetical protein
LPLRRLAALERGEDVVEVFKSDGTPHPRLELNGWLISPRHQTLSDLWDLFISNHLRKQDKLSPVERVFAIPHDHVPRRKVFLDYQCPLKPFVGEEI